MDLNPVLLPQVTNRESMTLPIGVNDAVTGDPIDLTGCTIDLAIYAPRQSAGSAWDGYSTSFDDNYSNCGPILTASIGSGITVVDVGVFQVYFSAASMRTLSPKTYDVGCVITRDIDARQLFLGRLPVFFGNVP